jgi:hypothetical protein
MSNTSHSQEDAFAPSAPDGGQRYYFDTHDGERFIPDEEGVALHGIEQARAEALKALPDMARDALPSGGSRDFVVEVRDDAGRKLLRVSLSLVVQPLA